MDRDEHRPEGAPGLGGRARRLVLAGLVATLGILLLVVTLYALRESGRRAGIRPLDAAPATFVGSQSCRPCHEEAYQSWRGSHHDHAMEAADETTVRGDFDDAVFERGDVRARFYRQDGRFFVHTRGPDGVFGDFAIAYTFGFEPLQQYLVPFPGGRLQALTIAWDTQRGEWFDLYPDRAIPPDDWLHWTRAGQNWNGMCAECHSTNLVKGYDPATRTFATTWSEIDVGCEACHGPGSRHVAWAKIEPMARPEADDLGLVIRTRDLSSTQQVELCAPCHARRTELGDYDHTRVALLDHQVPAVLREGLYHADGQILEEVYVYGSFVQSKMYRNGVRCGDCHDVHSLQLVQPGNALCLQCHRADAYDRYDHHFHQKVHEGRPSDGALCVKCHMPEQPYMVIDDRADHSLRVPRPDLSLAIGVPNACSQSGCHDDRPVEWSAQHYETWYGKAKKPHYGTTLAAGRARRPEAHAELIRLAADALSPPLVRATALSLLGAYPGARSTAAFHRGLADDDALVRYTAVSSANPTDPAQLVELVAPLLFDPVRAVRMQAATRLAGTPDPLLKPYQQEALAKALDEYQAAMVYSLDFAFAGHNLGNLHARLGEPEKAAAYYRSAIEIDALFYPAKANLAVLYNSMGRNADAEALLREVLDANPGWHDTAYSLGLLLAEMNRFAEAVGYLERAAQGMPARSRVHYNLALARQRLRRTAAAEAAFLHALRLEPQNVDYLYALADHYLKRGEPRQALPLAERIITAHPENPLGRELKAFVERALQRGGGKR
ncbi:MAG: tetratricopeptide repeat protein [Planctomycetota bacterium]|jgi:predicted CXXCH cytochrome family protein